MNFQSRIIKLFIILFGVLIVVAAIAGGVLYAIYSKDGDKIGIGAIASNGVECAEMGKKMFERGGNVADVAVTTMLCEGISSPQSCGIGGGFIAVIYLKSQGIIQTINARERAPRNSTVDMYVAEPKESTHGGKAVAVPGDLKGMWEMHQKYGLLKWKEVLEPVIDMCKNGHTVGPFLEEMLTAYEDELLAEPSLREIFMNPATNRTWKLNDKMKRPKLAETLEIIANEGIDAMYGGGKIGKKFVADVQKYGGIMIEKDLKDYRVEWSDPVSTTITNNSTVYTSPLPSSGSMLILMLNILRNDKLEPNLVSYQRMIESMKLSFAHRTMIGAEANEEVLAIAKNMVSKSYGDALRRFVNDNKTSTDVKYYGVKHADVDDRGTAHISILAPNGDAIAVTNTINDIFGAMWRSQSTGIIPNDEMDDFSVPGKANADGVLPSPNNFAIPGNNPISSMTPTIVLDRNGDVRLLIGAAGGRRIITSTFYTLYRNIFFNETLEDAMAAPRIHHQLTPMELVYSSHFDADIIKSLNETMGHKVRATPRIANVVGVSVENGNVKASYDPFRGGSTVIFEGKY
ncbi:unnamed protein product [Chironomus riparius]|uniref:Gamma-glutamyltransferase n=1 Tax=Chironomus riparius TaxID=315576 RepID=A0A9N9S6H5_9DIPT|nr:unnamed protein product [Chironomus riparius]